MDIDWAITFNCSGYCRIILFYSFLLFFSQLKWISLRDSITNIWCMPNIHQICSIWFCFDCFGQHSGTNSINGHIVYYNTHCAYIEYFASSLCAVFGSVFYCCYSAYNFQVVFCFVHILHVFLYEFAEYTVVPAEQVPFESRNGAVVLFIHWMQTKNLIHVRFFEVDTNTKPLSEHTFLESIDIDRLFFSASSTKNPMDGK